MRKDYAHFVELRHSWLMRGGCSKEFHFGAVITTYAAQIGKVDAWVTSRVVKTLFL